MDNNIKKNDTPELTREDLVQILGGSNVMNALDTEDNNSFNQVQKQQQESLACDAIG